jgi:hypothetical protein
MVMACNSTPVSLDAIAHFLEIMESSDPEVQKGFCERFFAVAEAAEQLKFLDSSGSAAVLEHQKRSLEWNLQAGPLDWGEQQIAPSGEMSVLPLDIMRFDAGMRMPLNGEVVFHGQPVLHAGAFADREDQLRVYSGLAALTQHSLVASVREGVIDELRAGPDVRAAAATLEELFSADDRYRVIWEIGFGLNTALKSPLPGNYAMNEVFGGANGIVHWGLGLTPHTRYALILPSIKTRVVGANGAVALGAEEPSPARRMRRRVTATCGCHF